MSGLSSSVAAKSGLSPQLLSYSLIVLAPSCDDTNKERCSDQVYCLSCPLTSAVFADHTPPPSHIGIDEGTLGILGTRGESMRGEKRPAVLYSRAIG